MNGSPSFATRPAGSWPGSSARTNSARCGCAMVCTSSATRRCCGCRFPTACSRATQLRMLAHIARRYDRDYGHFTTRQNIQYNWPALERVPDILADLASVEMHAIQTSGNCIRNITADHLAGVAPDEIADPRPYCEIIRQWSTLHPEFSYLPRKFKIAVTASPADRAAVEVHDVGVRLKAGRDGEIGFEILAGGGLGRTPIIGKPDPQLPAAGRPAGLPGGDPAGLQPPRPPRQHPQGAHQDPGAKRSGWRNSPARWSRNSRPRASSHRAYAAGGRAHARLLCAAALPAAGGCRCLRLAASAPARRPTTPGCATTRRRHKMPAIASCSYR
jgi:hypothetical protein